MNRRRTPNPSRARGKQIQRRSDEDNERCPRRRPEGAFLAKSRQPARPWWDVVRAVVAHNPALPFTAATVARAARLSPNHFSSLFRKHSGETFSDFLTSQRVRLARDLLSDLTLSVNEVASRAGFQDAGYFSKRFKRTTGLSPLECRRANIASPSRHELQHIKAR